MTDNKIEIRLPQMGMASQDIIFLRWLKSAGDAVTEGEELFEVESDKATVVFVAENSGTIEDFVVTQGVVKEGDLLGYINA